MNFSAKMSEFPLRKLIIMRHAERIDFTFGDWTKSSFDEKGNYIRRNLNMPISVPTRLGGPGDFKKDSPLTRIGGYQATLAGEAMKDCNMKFDYVFCSPSLRCVETCTNVLKASNQTHLKINIEPGLFEWTGWYRDGMPIWMNLQELQACDFSVSLDYKPVINASDIDIAESCEEYYIRSFHTTLKLLETYPGDILLVAHAGSLDSCSRQLTGRAPLNGKELIQLVLQIPYTSVCIVEEKPDHAWQINSPPFPPLRHCDALGFDWKVLLS